MLSRAGFWGLVAGPGRLLGGAVPGRWAVHGVCGGSD